MKNLITEYPNWALILCVLLGLIFAALLYYRNQRTSEMSRRVVILLAFLRFATVSIIAFLFLGPMIKYLDVSLDQPVVVIAADNTSSIILEGDSAGRIEKAKAIRDMLADLREKLAGEYEVADYTFGQEVREGEELDFSEPVTDISNLFASLKNRYANRNLGAVIVATDGIYNRGSNPRYATAGLKAPIYTIALGDTTVRRDLKIAETGSNRIAFLNNKFPIEARVEATKMDGRSIRFTISENGNTLFEESIQATSDNFAHTFRALLDADTPGLHAYRLEVSGGGDETTLANNSRTVYIDVIDSRRKVLIVAEAPHPDVNAIREAVESNENYEVVARLASGFDGDLKDFDLVITHNLPGPSMAGRQFAQRLADSELPFWAISGLRMDRNTWSELPTGLTFAGGGMKSGDVKGLVNRSFAKFTLPEGLDALIREAPPVQVPFGAQITGAATEAVLYQRVGPVETTDPLLVVREVAARRTAAFAGEGLWRWRIYNYAIDENHDTFDALINGVVQYLALKEDKRFFRLSGRHEYMENERVVITAELYDESYEPVTDGEVALEITDAEGRIYPFIFSSSGKTYRLDAGVFPVGTYSYTARVGRGGKNYEDSGRFVVRPFALESADLTADHNLLRAISANTGGRMYSGENTADLIDHLTREGQILKPVSHTSQVLKSLLDFKWIFFVLLAFLSFEWFLRKRSGYY